MGLLARVRQAVPSHSAFPSERLCAAQDVALVRLVVPKASLMPLLVRFLGGSFATPDDVALEPLLLGVHAHVLIEMPLLAGAVGAAIEITAVHLSPRTRT